MKSEERRTHPRHRYVRMFILVVGAIVMVVLWGAIAFSNGCAISAFRYTDAEKALPAYAGSASCATCHVDATAKWRGSHHDHAMRVASDSSVAGDFADARFTAAGVTTTFFRRDGHFIVNTDGPDGALYDYEVKYTFGVDPLQQYLVEIPGGRLQALPVAWDTRPRSRGGQRWFHLHPNQHIASTDTLHWTGLRQNWNYMCADCHSTGVKKRYDAATNTFASAFVAPNVGCEACHGPGASHVASNGKVAFATVKRSAQVEQCAQCHSRREQFTDTFLPGNPLGNSHRVALIDTALYYVDGQIRDETYEYGSFVQSRMYAKGVTCSDCHDPHSAKLTKPGSQVCANCHAPETYQATAHHHHKATSPGADCVSCHMPTTTYMVVHERHDHSIRVPRPDRTVKLGVPNACTQCHSERPAAWAAQQVVAWYGRTPRSHQQFAEAFGAAAKGDSSATRLLIAAAGDRGQPAIARASALERLAARVDASFNGAFTVIQQGLTDTSALVRRAAVTAFAQSDASVRTRMVSPLLRDSIRAVRMEAARALAGDKDVDLAEYIAGQAFNADRPEARVNLGVLYASLHRIPDAERELRAALVLDGRFVPALVNLADLYRATQRDREGEVALRSALAIDPTNAAVSHALGLLLVRSHRIGDALVELGRADRLAPDITRYAAIYAMALDAAGQGQRATAVLSGLVSRNPFDRNALSTFVDHLLTRGDTTSALVYLRRLAAMEPSNAQLSSLVQLLAARESQGTSHQR